MLIKTLIIGSLYTNCYIVGDIEAREAPIVDPGFEKEVEAKGILKKISQHDLQVKYIVNTHGHPDHTCGNYIIKKTTGAPILIHANDAPMLTEAGKVLTRLFGLSFDPLQADKLLHDGDIIKIGDVKLAVLHTPGHSRGSISLLGDEVVFTGDTLFAGSIGRYDLPGGLHKKIMLSIKKDWQCYPITSRSIQDMAQIRL